jgi:hypothetical protein
MNTGALNFFANYRPSNFNRKLCCYFDFNNIYTDTDFITSDIGKDKDLITGYFLSDQSNYIFNTKLDGQSVRNAYFGTSVGMNNNGDIAVMGGPYDNVNIAGDLGSAMIFTKNQNNEWVFKQKITGDNRLNPLFPESFNYLYGKSIAINNTGNIIIMGGPFGYYMGSPSDPINPDLFSPGAAVIYTGNSDLGWAFFQLISGNKSGAMGYGTSLSVNNDASIIIMGGPLESTNNVSGAGAAMIFTGNVNNGWIFKQKITGDTAYFEFGTSLASNEDANIIVMGGPNNLSNPNATPAPGAILIFTGNQNIGWNLKQKITGQTNGDLYGNSVSVSNNGSIIAVGSKSDDQNGVNAGSVYLYTGNSNIGWTFKQKLTGRYSYDVFGTSVKVGNGDKIYVGSPKLFFGSQNQNGEVYIFTGNSGLGWKLSDILTGEYSESPYSEFGSSIAVNKKEDIILIGSPFDTYTGYNSISETIDAYQYGSASIFKYNNKRNFNYLSGNYIEFKNINNSSFNFNDFTCVLSFEKTNYEGGVLLSSIDKTTGLFLDNNGNFINQTYYKGFEFGITSNNYLYFEYFKNDGPVCLVGNNKINDKSIIYLSIFNNNINYGYVDFVKNRLINENRSILNNYLFDQNNLYIAYNPNAENLYTSNKKLVGYMDDLIITSSSLLNYEIANLSSGFIYDFVSASEYTFSTVVNEITGSYFGITGYRTEITGSERVATGLFTNPWGITVMGYINQPLIKQVPLSGIFYLSGDVEKTFVGFSGAIFNKNNDKFLSYQKNIINFVNKITNDDIIEYRFLTGFNNLFFNKKNLIPEYNRYRNSYKNELITTNSFHNLFVNGQLQRSGNLLDTNIPYTNINFINSKIVEHDYGIDSNKNIIFANSYGLGGQFSSIIIDASSGEAVYVGEIENYIDNQNLNLVTDNKDLFLNGQKLVKNIDYFQDENGSIITNSEYNFIQKITGESPSDSYGQSVARSNDAKIIALGGNLDDINTINNGGIIILVEDSGSWMFKQRITGSIISNARFGTSTDMNYNGSVIIGGAPFDNVGALSSAGSTSIFTGNYDIGWKFKQKLTGDSAFDNFGQSICISKLGDIIVMGGWRDRPNNVSNAGSAMIFTGNADSGWTFKQKITGDQMGGNFGYSVDMSDDGNTIILGGFSYPSVFGRGAIKIFTGNANNGWVFQQQLLGNNIQNAGFGNNVTINKLGNIILTSNYENTSQSIKSVEIFTKDQNNNWNFRQKILPPFTNGRDSFGSSISIDENNQTLIIGNPSFYTGEFSNTYPGAIFVYTGSVSNGWDFDQMFIGNGSTIGESFGIKTEVAKNGEIVIGTAIGDQFEPLNQNGGAYIYINKNKNTIFSKNPSGSLVLLPINYDNNYIEINGNPILNLNQNFYSENSEIYVNGIRQTLNYDYLEFSKFDVTTGIKILLENNKDYIYNNEGFIK